MAEKPDTHTVLLRRVPLFAELTPEELQILAQDALPRRYGRGEQVVGEGEPCEGHYVIESRSVRIFKISPGGREQVLALERAGNSIAELPFDLTGTLVYLASPANDFVTGRTIVGGGVMH